MTTTMKCDFCTQPGIELAGESNGVLVCIDHAHRTAPVEAQRDEYERRWEEDARPAFAIIEAVERLADLFDSTPDWSMSHRNVAISLRTALATEEM